MGERVSKEAGASQSDELLELEDILIESAKAGGGDRPDRDVGH
jgi:hypothetical protein